MDSFENTPQLEITDDAALVMASLAGDRRAFGKIVERYQRLLCSLAYSATGELSQSEDLAQETFIEAWRKLHDLREPGKLRPWLCGILRFKVSRSRRSDSKEPVRRADGLEHAEEVPSADEYAPDAAMQQEEQALLWNTLQRLPESYREPLILYYREQRSVEHVAAALDLSEDAVKQRLARGRKILQEQVLSFVEGALARSTPGRLFTITVIAMLPELSRPAKAASIGAAAVKGGMMAKSTGLAALLASCSGMIGAVLTLRANLDQSRTPKERRMVVIFTVLAFFGALAFLALLYGLGFLALRQPAHRGLIAILTQGWVVAGIVAWPWLLTRGMRRQRELRTSERREHPELFLREADRIGSPQSEYTSRLKIFGIPVFRMRFATPDQDQPPVFAWIAGGDRAVGLLAAWGGIAVAPLSVGAVSVGILSLGSLSLGAISMGTVGVGLVALGCASIGVRAFAWLSALGWQTAQSSGFAIARIAAEGPLAIAAHANDPIARQFLANPHQEQHQSTFFIVVSLVSLIPVILYASEVRKRLGAGKMTSD